MSADVPLPQHAGAASGALPPAVIAGYVVLYFLLDWVSYIHPMRGTSITPWNPQAALAVALLARHPRGWWLVGCTLVGAALARALPTLPLPDMAASAALTLGYAGTALALRRWIGPSPWIATRSDYLVFLLIVGVGSALNSVIYAGVLSLFGASLADRLAGAMVRGWIGDAVSLIVTLPAILALADRTQRSQAMAMLRTVESWLIAGAAVVAAYAVFGRSTEDQFKFFYLLFLPVAWGAARFGNVGAAWSSALVQLLLILAVQSSPYQPLTVFELHMLMAALGATALLLGATVDEREQAEQALRASLHVAAAADMAAALAHELNQPLTALRTYAKASQLLAERLGDTPRPEHDSLVDVTSKLVGEANRAGEVVKRLRDFFRQRGTHLQPTGIGPLIDEVIASQAMRAQAVEVALESECDPALPAVWMDRVQIEVVLRNLVSNAIDAAAEAAALHALVRVRASVRGAQVQVEVRDSGPGIAVEELPHIFESRRSSKAGGMGIGLVISRSIVEAHEGRLWAEPGPGGKFFFSLPLSGAEEHA